MTNKTVIEEIPAGLEALIERKVEERLREKMSQDKTAILGNLPENAFLGDDGNLYHRISRMTDGGSWIETTRPLARTLEEAREKRIDFYHPTLGIIWNGYKIGRDRSPQDIIKDTSVGGQAKPGEVPVPTSNLPPVDDDKK